MLILAKKKKLKKKKPRIVYQFGSPSIPSPSKSPGVILITVVWQWCNLSHTGVADNTVNGCAPFGCSGLLMVLIPSLSEVSYCWYYKTHLRVCISGVYLTVMPFRVEPWRPSLRINTLRCELLKETWDGSHVIVKQRCKILRLWNWPVQLPEEERERCCNIFSFWVTFYLQRDIKTVKQKLLKIHKKEWTDEIWNKPKLRNNIQIKDYCTETCTVYNFIYREGRGPFVLSQELLLYCWLYK